MRVGDHVLRARNRHLHVALPRTEEHIAHQQVADHHGATRSGDGQVIGAAGGQRGKLSSEAAAAVGAGGDAVPGERHHNRFAGCRIARQVDGLAALDHTMVGQDAIEPGRGTGRGTRSDEQQGKQWFHDRPSQ